MTETTVNSTDQQPLGLTPNRIRGLLAMLLLLGVVYFTIFESDPPLGFTEVEIEIPPKPASELEEKEIVLPEFADSPLVEEELAVGVEISTIDEQPAVELTTIEPQAGDVAPAPDKVSTPAQEKVIATTAVEAATATAPAAKGGFYVQVVALSGPADAQAMATKLAEALNELSYVQQVERGGKPLYRVRLGPFGSDQGKANEVLNRLRTELPNLGGNAFVAEQ